MYATFSTSKKLANTDQMQAYQVPDLVHFDQVKTIDVPELGLVHLRLGRSITKKNKVLKLVGFCTSAHTHLSLIHI